MVTWSPPDVELALKLGALLLNCLSGQNSEVFRMIDESALSFAQMKVLIALDDDADETSTVTSLSERLGFSAASASRAAEGLVKKGLASRVEDPSDRRVRRLELTSAGSELAERIVSARLAGLEAFTSSLSASQRRKLDAALDALLERDEIAEIHRTYERRLRR